MRDFSHTEQGNGNAYTILSSMIKSIEGLDVDSCSYGCSPN